MNRSAPRRSPGRSEGLPEPGAGPLSLHRDRPAGREAAEGLAETLAFLVGRRVHLTLTDNASTMVSFRKEAGLLRIRIHHMFLDAAPEVVASLARYTEGCSLAGREIRDFVRSNEARLRSTREARQGSQLVSLGNFHDLQAAFDDLNRTLFGGRVQARIGWGRNAPQRRRRSIRLGVYLHESRVIRIHPALDREEVPAFFVRFVVFHEMLHQVVPVRTVGGRRQAHSKEFRALEKAYPDYERAIAWEKENIGLLLRSPSRRYVFDWDDPLA